MNRADLEHYESVLVLTVAKKLANKPWDALSYRSKQRCLNKAGDILLELISNPECFKRLEDAANKGLVGFRQEI